MRKLIGLGVVLAAAGVVSAQSAGVTGYSGGAFYSSYYGSVAGDVIGYTFEANASVILTDLGILWNDADGALNGAHDVGLWDTASQTLLASANVTAAGNVVGNFVYVDVPDVALNMGQRYTIGAVYTPTDSDSYLSGLTSITMAPEFSWLNSNYPTAAEMGFVFPGNTSTSKGRLGPNFLWVVPAPSSLALLGLGALAARRRR